MRFFALIPFLIFVLVPDQVAAHGGRLDANGCHHDTKTGGYHCHRNLNPYAAESLVDINARAARTPHLADLIERRTIARQEAQLRQQQIQLQQLEIEAGKQRLYEQQRLRQERALQEQRLQQEWAVQQKREYQESVVQSQGTDQAAAANQTDQIFSQQALELNRINEASVWRNGYSGNRYTIIPTRNYTDDTGKPCREFVYEAVYTNGQTGRTKGAACRGSDGEWDSVE